MSLEVMEGNFARDLYERLRFKIHYIRMVLKINDNIFMGNYIILWNFRLHK